MPEIVYRYTGKDPMQAHHSGIPARDLTDEDWAGLDADQKKTVRGSSLYEHVEQKAAEPKKADDKR